MNVSPQNATTSLGLSMKSPGKQSVFAIKSAKLPAIERRIPQKSRSLSAKKDMPDTAGGSPGATSLRTGHSSVGSPSPGAASHVVTAAARRQPIGASTFLLDGDDDEDNEDDEDDVDDEDKDMTDDDGPIRTIHTRGSFKPLPTFQVSAASEAIPLKKKKKKGVVFPCPANPYSLPEYPARFEDVESARQHTCKFHVALKPNRLRCQCIGAGRKPQNVCRKPGCVWFLSYRAAPILLAFYSATVLRPRP
jgi:hypothetical protein